jgi:hypothetical protein
MISRAVARLGRVKNSSSTSIEESGGKSGVSEKGRECDGSWGVLECVGECEGDGSMSGDLMNLFSREVKLAKASRVGGGAV